MKDLQQLAKNRLGFASVSSVSSCSKDLSPCPLWPRCVKSKLGNWPRRTTLDQGEFRRLVSEGKYAPSSRPAAAGLAAHFDRNATTPVTDLVY